MPLPAHTRDVLPWQRDKTGRWRDAPPGEGQRKCLQSFFKEEDCSPEGWVQPGGNAYYNASSEAEAKANFFAKYLEKDCETKNVSYYDYGSVRVADKITDARLRSLAFEARAESNCVGAEVEAKIDTAVRKASETSALTSCFAARFPRCGASIKGALVCLVQDANSFSNSVASQSFSTGMGISAECVEKMRVSLVGKIATESSHIEELEVVQAPTAYVLFEDRGDPGPVACEKSANRDGCSSFMTT